MSRKHAISAVGVAIALGWIFPNYNWIPGARSLSGNIFSILLKTAVMLVLMGLGLGLRHRPVGFYRIHAFRAADLASIPMVLAVIVIVVNAVAPQDPLPDGYAPIALWLGLLSALAAGVCEEFIYRGYLIEELGELVHSRNAAGAVSVVFFALAHIHNFGVNSVVDLAPQFFLGMLLTTLYFWRGNLLLCMTVHVAIDLMDVIGRRLS